MMRRRGGFTLLEVMAAVAILAMVLVVALASQGSSMNVTSRVRELTRAQAAAETAMDSFLASPEFVAAKDGTFSAQDEVTVAGYEKDGFEITRTIVEHVPLDDQGTVELNPQDTAAARAEAAKAAGAVAEQEPQEYDPGTFLAVRIEVRRAGVTRPLVAMETWLPKPTVPGVNQASSSGGALGDTGGGATGPSGPTGGGGGPTGTLPSIPRPPAGGNSGGGGGGAQPPDARTGTPAEWERYWRERAGGQPPAGGRGPAGGGGGGGAGGR